MAGYSRTNFYQYFQDIYDLLEQLEDMLIQYLGEQTDERMFDEQKEATAYDVAEIYSEKARYFTVLLKKTSTSLRK